MRRLIDAGKFISTAGYENPLAIDNLNYSIGLTYNLLDPNTLTGLRLHYTFTDRFDASLYATNAWDAFSNRNLGFTYGLGLNYTFGEQWSANFNTLIGPQQVGNATNFRGMYDAVVTFKPNKEWLLVGEVNYGNEPNTTAGPGNAHWNGASLWIKRQITDSLALTVRPELVNDITGALTGIPQALKAVTFTPEIKLPGGIILRPEIRRDWSNATTFDRNTRKGQTIVGIGVLYQHSFSLR